MTTKPSGGILSSILRKARGIFFAPKASQNPIENEEYVTEHFLLYHGLAGSSPANQREFRDVKADIQKAVKAQSSVQLTIALKLPPLWWADRLKSIVSEIQEQGDLPTLLNLLIPDDEKAYMAGREDPLASDSWQSRANASILLAHARETRAVPHLIICLNECSDGSLMPAFCHIITALADLGTENAKSAIIKHLGSDEPWFRVDAASALSNWSMEESADTLMGSMLEWHTFADYQAVAISRKHKPLTLLRRTKSETMAGELQTVIGILEASTQTYSPDIVAESEVPYCWPVLIEKLREKPSSHLARATSLLADWLSIHAHSYSHMLPNMPVDIAEQLASFNAWLNSPDAEDLLLSKLEERSSESKEEIRHTLKLIEKLKIAQASQHLCALLQSRDSWLDETIQAAGSLENSDLTDKLVDLAEALVDMDYRCSLPRSKSPIAERDADRDRQYWHILKALGSAATERSSKFLLAATSDFAPDKRQQALESLISSYRNGDNNSKLLAEINNSTRDGLRDPSWAVKIAAVKAVGHFNFADLIADTARHVDAKEVSLRKEAFKSLRMLRAAGNDESVKKIIKGKIAGELDPYKRTRLEDFLNESIV